MTLKPRDLERYTELEAFTRLWSCARRAGVLAGFTEFDLVWYEKTRKYHVCIPVEKKTLKVPVSEQVARDKTVDDHKIIRAISGSFRGHFQPVPEWAIEAVFVADDA